MKKIALLIMAVIVNLSTAQQTEEENQSKAPYDFLDIFDSSRRDKEEVLTSTRLGLAFGFSQALGEDNGIGEDYQFWGSGVFGVDLSFHTRLNPNNDKLRFVYGLGLYSNVLHIKDDKAFVTQGQVTRLQPLGFNADRSQFMQTTLMLPLHLEFGSREQRTFRDGLMRYQQDDAFVFGVGGYLGWVTTSSQIVKFDREGRDVTVTTTNDYEVNNFSYGLSVYAGYDDAQLFLQYGLNDILDNSPTQQHYVSLGIRIR